jgi:hypothetical protein
MIARLAYLTTPAPGVFVLNIQPEGQEGIQRFEISKAHLANILISGTAVALREPSRTAFQSTPTENAHDDVRRQQPA